MADELIGALRIVLGMDTAQIDEGVKRARGQLNSFGKQVEAVFAGTGLTRIVERAFDAIAHAIKSVTVEAFTFADDMGKMAQKVGVSVEELTSLKLAADLADVSLESLSSGLGKLSKNMTAAAEGNKQIRDEFGKLGIDVRDSAGNIKSAIDVLIEMADKFEGTSDGAAKVASALALLGKGGKDLIPLLNEGGESMRKWAEVARNMGLVVDKDTSAKVQQFNDNLKLVSLSIQGIANLVVKDLINIFLRVSNSFADSAKKGDLVRDSAKGISAAIKEMIVWIAVAAEWNKVLGGALLDTQDAAVKLGDQQTSSIGKWIEPYTKKIGEAYNAFIKWKDSLGGNDVQQSLNRAVNSMQPFVDAFGDIPKKTTPAGEALDKAGSKLDSLGKIITSVRKLLADLSADMAVTAKATQEATPKIVDKRLSDELNKLSVQARVLRGEFNQLPTGFAEMAVKLGLTDEKAKGLALTLQALTPEQKNLALAMGEVEARLIAQEMMDPAAKFEQLRVHLESLKPAFEKAGLDVEILSAKIDKEAASMRAAMGGVIQSAVSPWADAFKTLASMNKKFAGAAKALAIAEAIISTYVAANKALAAGFPPWNYIQAAGVVAAGLANVAKISSTEFAKGGSFVVPGGISGVDTAMVPLNLAAGERVDITPASEANTPSVQVIELRSPRVGDMFSEYARELVDTLNRVAADGYIIRMPA